MELCFLFCVMFNPDKSLLLVIDVQGKLASLVHEQDKLAFAVLALIKAAKILQLPIIYTEQVPAKIGTTIPPIADELTGIKSIEKNSFSCCGNESFLKSLRAAKRRQVIVAGIETHVCVYQTVADLVDLKYAVDVVVNAVSSRHLIDKTTALMKMEKLVAGMTTVEMIICELLKTAQHPRFRDLMALIK